MSLFRANLQFYKHVKFYQVDTFLCTSIFQPLVMISYSATPYFLKMSILKHTILLCLKGGLYGTWTATIAPR